MKTTLVFGTFAIGIGSAQGSYSAPSNLSKDMLREVFFDERMQSDRIDILSDDENENEVTHEVFFGENIQRVINTLSSRKV
jgi:hypothetical protein